MNSPSANQPTNLHPYPAYAPRFWHGMRAATWWRLMAANRFRVAPSRIPMSVAIAFITPVNDVLACFQRAMHGRRLRETVLEQPPVFIIGHWRSGTTFLHELMMLDPRLACPSTYQCFAPSHCLISEWFFQTFGKWMLPDKRPMDNVSAGWDRPQEDEFALMNLGLPSPYRRIAFPKNDAPDLDYLDFDGVPAEQVEMWLDGLDTFLKLVSNAQPGRVVLKSPTHTGRIKVLKQRFPNARFIHITRDPRRLLPSTMRLWYSLDSSQGLQRPDAESCREYVLECFDRMYASFHRDRSELDAHELVDIRYEDLVADPESTLRNVYSQLELGDFSEVEPLLQEWVEENHRDYKVNEHHLPADDESEILARWRNYFERYGYL